MMFRNLFTFNFREGYKRLCGVIIGVITLNMVVSGLNYMYVDHESDSWPRILWHNYYEEENIDYLYLGSSHVYRDVNPFLLDELNGGNNFNLSVGSQRMNGSYYLLREAQKKHDLKHVYVELFYIMSTGDKGEFLSDRSGRIVNWRNTDFMKPSINRLEYMLSMSNPEYYLETFVPFVRYRSHFFDWNFIYSNMEYKQTDDYKNYVCYEQEGEEIVEECMDKGFRFSLRTISQDDLKNNMQDSLSEEPITEEAEYYLRKIITYCKENDIEVTLFCSPMYELYTLSAGNYDNYVNQVRDIAEEYEVDYYDFNLCKEEFLNFNVTEDYFDLNHLNTKGANKFTEFFWKVMSGNSAENEHFFYSSWEEKLHETDGKIYGLLQINSEDNEYNHFMIASNRDNGMEYRVLLTPQDGETVMFQDFSENRIFDITNNEHGICTIVARESEEEDKVQTVEISY